jgi:hypothetical protein
VLRLDSKDVVEVVVLVLPEVLEIAVHQPLVMVGQVFKF